MSRILVLLSIPCPHFDDKASALVVLAGAAAEAGHDVVLALAGTRVCPHVARAAFDPAQCPEWHTRAALERFSLRAGIEVLTVSEETSLEEEVARGWERVRRVPAAERVFSGYDLTELCAASLARHLGLGAPAMGDREAFEAELHRDAIRHLLFYRHLMETKRPDAVVHFGGHFHKDRVASLACNERSIPCAAIEGAFVPNHMYWDEAGVSGNRGLIARADGLDAFDREMPSVDVLRSLNLMMERSFGTPRGEAESSQLDREAVRRYLGLDRSARVALFLAQVPYDSSLVEDGGSFADPVQAVQTVREALDPGCALVVRLHPKAGSESLATELERSCAGVGSLLVARCGKRDPDLLSLLRFAHLAVTVNSQAGLQASWLGLPVVVLGRAFYGGKGFTFDVNGNRAALQPALAGALATGPAHPSPRLLAYLALMQRDFLLPIADVRPALHRLHRMLEKARR